MHTRTLLGNCTSLKHLVPLASIALAAGLAAQAITGPLFASAQASTSGPALAQQYLAALTPAGAAISNAEARLEKLPVTATVAQVNAAVAPPPKALAQLEAL